MLIICPNCFAKFEVNDRLLKKNIQKFACSNCGERFEENLEALRADETEPFNTGAVAAASAEVMMQGQELGNQGRELLGVASEENAIRSTEDTGIQDTALAEAVQGQDGPSFNWTNQGEEDLSVQSLPEEFTPVQEPKKSKGLWFVFLFLLIVAGILAFAWYKRDVLLQQFPNVQKGIHLIMGKPYSTLPTAKTTSAVPLQDADDLNSNAVQMPAVIAEVNEANEQEPADPTVDIMNEAVANRSVVNQTNRQVDNQSGQEQNSTSSVQPVPRMAKSSDIADGQVRPLSMQGRVAEATDEVTLQEIDLNTLPGETGTVQNAVPMHGSNVNQTGAVPSNRNNTVQDLPLVIEEIHIDDDMAAIDNNAPFDLEKGAPYKTPTSAEGNISNGRQNGVNTAGANPGGSNARVLSRETAEQPIVLDDAVGVVIDQAPTVVQGADAAQSGGVQVKDVVFRYDTSLSSRPRLYVQGIVSNMSAGTITMPALTVEMFDKDNKLIGTQTLPATSSKLGSNMAEFFFREIDPLPTALVRRVNIMVQN